MKDYLAKKDQYASEFAHAMDAVFLKMKYGVKTCPDTDDLDRIILRYELAMWQSCQDFPYTLGNEPCCKSGLSFCDCPEEDSCNHCG